MVGCGVFSTVESIEEVQIRESIFLLIEWLFRVHPSIMELSYKCVLYLKACSRIESSVTISTLAHEVPCEVLKGAILRLP